MKPILLIAHVFTLICLTSSLLSAQNFTEVTTTIPALLGSSDWGDVDNDADLDLIITGSSTSWPETPKTYLCMNNGNGQFSSVTLADVPKICNGTARWLDFNNDGILDLFISGSDVDYYNVYTPVTKLFKGIGNTKFELTPNSFEETYSTLFDWADINNDGMADIALSGYTQMYPHGHCKVYENNNSTFSVSDKFKIQPLYSGAMQWGDYDGDGDLDLIQSGIYFDTYLEDEFAKTFLYRNDGGNLTLLENAGIPGAKHGSVEWGDYDNDGDLDLLFTGMNGSGSAASGTFKVYRNNGNDSFQMLTIDAASNHIYKKSKWGDFDNDGDLDIIVSGDFRAQPTGFVYIYKNTNGNFSKIASLCDVIATSIDWIDYDKDGDLDVFMLGSSDYIIKSKLFRNNVVQHNTRPEAPLFISAKVDKKKVHFSWSRSHDNQTPGQSLSYNIWVGSAPSTSDLMGPNSFLASGNRKIIRLGNTSLDTCWDLNFQLQARYYWAVQAIDDAFAGSFFSETGSFVIGSPYVETDEATDIKFTEAWLNGKVNPLELKCEVIFEFGTDTLNLNQSIASSFQGDTLFTVKTLVQNLTQNTVYYYRIKATNSVDTVVGEFVSFRTNTDGIAESFRELHVYPNPVSEVLFIAVPEIMDSNLTIFDNTGRQRIQIRISDLPDPNRIDIRGLETGLYTLMLNSGKYLYHSRFVKL